MLVTTDDPASHPAPRSVPSVVGSVASAEADLEAVGLGGFSVGRSRGPVTLVTLFFVCHGWEIGGQRVLWGVFEE